MKVGIITQPLQTNYGGLLQNYALQQILYGLGHEVYTINRKYPFDVYSFKLYKYLIFHIKQIIYKYIGKSYLPTKKEKLDIVKNCVKFIEDNILVTNAIISRKEYIELLKKHCFNAFVVGSDQVWRPQYSPNIMDDFFVFCQNEKNIKRIAYAASFGTSEWEFNEEETKECSRLAKLFDAISVREDSGIILCNVNLGVDAELVLDPTLLLDKEHYIKLVEKYNEEVSDGDLFCYILDDGDTINNVISDIVRSTSLKSFQVKANKSKRTLKRCEKISDYIIPSPTKWLRAFMDAKMVFTDSFHGCVFSIIFNKPFWVIGNDYRGNARFDSLLKLFNLENRRIRISEICNIDLTEPIDWEQVNSIKKVWQEKSINFLKDNL